MPFLDEKMQTVADFWREASCGEAYAQGDTAQARFERQAATRYRLEPYLTPFARFADGRGKDVLEIGVGMGADHQRWAQAQPRSLTGMDLTMRAVRQTRERLARAGHSSRCLVADAQRLPFADQAFGLVYAWGVLHHLPHTARAIKEVHRVLRPGGRARVMLYHRCALTGYLLWMRYALLSGRWRRSLSDVYAAHLESPGTQTFCIDEARALFAAFAETTVRIQLSFGDLLQGQAGARHGGFLIAWARRLWPRWLLRHLAANHGLLLLIEATKAVNAEVARAPTGLKVVARRAVTCRAGRARSEQRNNTCGIVSSAATSPSGAGRKCASQQTFQADRCSRPCAESPDS